MGGARPEPGVVCFSPFISDLGNVKYRIYGSRTSDTRGSVVVDKTLQKQMTCLEARSDIDLLFGHAVQFVSDEVGEEEKKRLACPATPVPDQVSSTLLARKAVFEQVGGFDKSLRSVWMWTGICGHWPLSARL